MDENIKCDLYRHLGRTDFKSFLKALMIPGFRYMYLLRNFDMKRKWTPAWFFYGLLLYRYHYKYGFQITSSKNIGKGFYIAHFGVVVINKEAVICNNCNIAHSVTIGKSNRGKLTGCPVIGNKVWMGTGSVIVGKISIGENVLIAPNSYVNFDVPADSIVIGNPGRIIPDKNATVNYIEHVVE